jgi:SNF family Na+-dependent transporter
MKRERWDSRLIFIFAAVGSAAGLGNLWRFPYLAYKYGGGAFLIPYIIMLFAIGIPLLMLEFSIGQRFQKGAIESMYAVNRNVGGFGLMGIINGFVIVTYYGVVIAWAVIFLLHSFTVAWAGKEVTFFYTDVLRLSDGIGSVGGVEVPILIALVAVWIMIYFSIWKGTKSAGKVVMITMPLPLLLIVVLAIRGVTLGTGSMIGISSYLIPTIGKVFTDIEVWNAAIAQIFFTLTLGFGTMIAYGSYNDRKSELIHSTYWTTLLNSSISLVAGFAIFGTIGFMCFNLAHEGVPGRHLISYQQSHNINEIPELEPYVKTYSLEELSSRGVSLDREELSAHDISPSSAIDYKTIAAIQKEKGISAFPALTPSRVDKATSRHFSYEYVQENNVPLSKKDVTRFHLNEAKLAGPGLAFIVYPRAIAMLQPKWIAAVFGVLFFITLITLGIDSSFSLVEAISTVVADEVHRRSAQVNRSILALVICVLAFFIGILFTTNGGLYFLDLVDHYVTSYGLVFVGLVQAVAVGWFFDIGHHRHYINSTSPATLGKWWELCIKYVIPVALVYIFINQLIKDIRTPYEGYPFWAQFIGWSVLVVPLLISIMFSAYLRMVRNK